MGYETTDTKTYRNFEQLINPRYEEFDTYVPALETMAAISARLGRPVEQVSKLDSNENALPVLPEVLEALKGAPYNFYPDPSQSQLRHAISNRDEVSPQNVICSNGAADMVYYLCQLFLEPGDFAVTTTPGYGLFGHAISMTGAEAAEWPLSDGFDLQPDLLHLDDPKLKLLFLVTPDNPSGLVRDVWGLLHRCARHGVVLVVDETYVEFAHSDDPTVDHGSIAPWVPEHGNLVVLRSFSKAAGIAGLRLGYGVMPRWMAQRMWDIKIPADVTMAGQEAGLALLNCWHKVEQRIELIRGWREDLYRVLRSHSELQPVEGSQANFILCKVLEGGAAQLKSRLEVQGVLVRHYSGDPRLNDYIRITVGSDKSVGHVAEALDRIF